MIKKYKEKLMDYKKLLNNIAEKYQKILKENLVGIYVHGSIAFNCFNPAKSDIDFLVVVGKILSLEEKKDLIKVLLDLSDKAPEKGFEISVVLYDVCKNFIYPTPFELHFSNAYDFVCREDLTKYCENMNGTDKDLAAHFTVIKNVGYVLCGESIENIFGDIPKEYYFDSIKCDIENAKDEIIENPVYIILNLCRVLAYKKQGLVLSKAQGGIWGAEHIPQQYILLIKQALECYQSNKTEIFEEESLIIFSKYMLQEIFKS